MGGKSSAPSIAAPTPPPAPPSYASQLQDYIKTLPDLLNAQTKYDPRFAQQQLDLLNQYGLPISQSLQNIDKSLYPNTAGLQEQIAGIASQGMTSQLPDLIAQQYQSDFNAGIGANANAPIGVSARNIGLYNLQEDWKRYYQNLGLSAAGRQPLIGPSSPNAGQSTQGFGGALNYGASTYGAYAPAFAQQNLLAFPKSGGSFGGLLGGAAAGGLAGFKLGGPWGAAAGALGGGAMGGGFF